MKKLLFLLLLLSAAGFAQPARYTLENGIIHTATKEAFQGHVVVSGSQIESVGRGPGPGGAKIDLGGLHLYPGLIDVDSSIGLIGVESLRATRDEREVGFINPNLVAKYAFRAESDSVGVARSQGLLYSGVNPYGSLIAGQGSVMRLWGWNWEEMTARDTWALAIDWPRVSILPTQKKRDKSLKAIGERLFLLDEAFAEALSYQESDQVDSKWSALKPYADGSSKLLIRVDGKQQIRSALDWTKKKRVNPVLVAGRDIHLFAEELAERKIPVVYASLFNQNPRDRETYDLHYRVPKLLKDKGVLVSLSAKGLAFDARELRDLGGRAKAFGLSKLEALQMLCLNPAKTLGADSQLGSIEAGKEASFVLVNGDILEVGPQVTRAWGAGRELDLVDHQKALYQKYRQRLLELKGRKG